MGDTRANVTLSPRSPGTTMGEDGCSAFGPWAATAGWDHPRRADQGLPVLSRPKGVQGPQGTCREGRGLRGPRLPPVCLHLSPFVFQEKTKYPRYRDRVSPRGICSFKTCMCIPLEGQSSWKIGGSYLHRTSQRGPSVQGARSAHSTPARPGQRPAALGPCPQPPRARAPPCASAFQP